MCNVSTTDEVTAGALPPSVLELLDASVPPERAEALRAFAVAFTRRLPPQDLRSRDRRHGHRLDLDVSARLIGVDLQEHVTDAQGRALAMGDDDLDLLHVGHYRVED